MLQPLFVRPLRASEKEVLLTRSRSRNREEAWRADVILLSAQGKTAAQISESLGFHSSNIKKWIRRFNEKGIEGIAVKKRGPLGGPRPKFTREQIEKILRLARSNPSELGLGFKEWTPQKLATAAVRGGIVDSISHVTVRQILKKADGSESGARETSTSETGPGTRLERGIRLLRDSEFEGACEAFSDAILNESLSAEDEALARALLSQSLCELSKYEEARGAVAVYEDSEALSRLSPTIRARVRLRIGWVHSWLRNYPLAIAALNEAKKLFLEMQDQLGVAEAHYAIGRTYIGINEFRIARDHLLAAASLDLTASSRELLARIHLQLSAVDFSEGAFSASKSNSLRALELAEGSSNTNLLGMILVNLGTAIFQFGGVFEGYRGERGEAVRYLKRAISYLEEGGQKDYLTIAFNNLGDTLRYDGRWEEAIEFLNRAIEIARKPRRPNSEATARITLAQILCAQGKLAEAESHLKTSLDLIEGEADKWLESSARRVLANVQKTDGKIELALKTLRDAMRLSTSIGDLHGVTLSQAGLAELHYLQGGLDQAREYLELAQGRLKEEKSLLVSGMIQRLAGQLEVALGRYGEARQLIAQSISIFTTAEMPYEVARSQYEMGILMFRSGDVGSAESHLGHARQAFEKLGAAPDLRKAIEASEELQAGNNRTAASSRPARSSDVLLMQRLIEASASRELLLQELASVVYEDFDSTAVIVCRQCEDDRLEPVLWQGITEEEGIRICQSLSVNSTETSGKGGAEYFARLGEYVGSTTYLFVRAGGDVDVARLQPLLKQADLGLEACSLRGSAQPARTEQYEHKVRTVIPGFICCSSLMFDVVTKIHKIRTSDVTVLITGESGTGKELVARAIHAESARARAIFLPFNCTATPKEIIDSQLFGHRRGAFTGATTNYPGIIKAADGGTLFLDEIGDLSLEVQPKLMRFLQEAEIQPLGETKPLRVDVRVIAATNTELERAVEDGRFREDLFHRLNIIRIHVPPLRDRPEEVPVLATYFLDHFARRTGKREISLKQEAIDALTNHDWPGNVRQLRNEIERVIAYSGEGARIGIEDLSPEVAHGRKRGANGRMSGGFESSYRASDARSPVLPNGGRSRLDPAVGGRLKLKEATAALERQLIEEALVRNRNNLSRTAIDLGLSRRGLRLKLVQLGISRETAS